MVHPDRLRLCLEHRALRGCREEHLSWVLAPALLETLLGTLSRGVAPGLYSQRALSKTQIEPNTPRLAPSAPPKASGSKPFPRPGSQPLSQQPNCQTQPYRTRNGFPNGTALLLRGTRSHTALTVLYLSTAWFLIHPPRNLSWMLRWELSGFVGGVQCCVSCSLVTFPSVSVPLFLLY